MVEPHPVAAIAVQRPPEPPPAEAPGDTADTHDWIWDMTFAAMDVALPIVRGDVTAREFRDVMHLIVGNVLTEYQQRHDGMIR